MHGVRLRGTMRVMTAPVVTIAPGPEDVILRDGSTLRLRSPQPDDEQELIAFLRWVSPNSRLLRFPGGPLIDGRTVAAVLGPDWYERGSLPGEPAGADGVPRPVAP